MRDTLLNFFFDDTTLVLAGRVLSAVLHLVKRLTEVLPGGSVAYFLADAVHASPKEMLLFVRRLFVVIPVKHLLQEVTLVHGLADETVIVAFFSHEGDVGDVVADTFGEEAVHALGILKAGVRVGHQALLLLAFLLQSFEFRLLCFFLIF